MPLQNRVSPFGNLFADRSRGTLMGNRGGRIHTSERTLTQRRWTSRQWICCALHFKGRQRTVWGEGYTELFFLDEPTAFAAGHRPCFECRRRDALHFADCWRQVLGLKIRPRAAAMDVRLHAQRLDGRAKRVHALPYAELPDGAFVAIGDEALAVRGRALLRWSPAGYLGRRSRPRGMADVLTPPAILAVLRAGYGPRWHPSAE